MKNNINIKEKMQKVNLENIKSSIKTVLIDLYTNSKNWTLVTDRPYYKVFLEAGIPKSKIPVISSALLEVAVVEHTGFNRITTYKFNTTKFEKPDLDALVDEVIKKLDEATLISSQKWNVIKRSAKVTKLQPKTYEIKSWVYLMYKDEIRYGRILNISTEWSGALSELDMDSAKVLYEVFIPGEGNTETTYDVFGDMDSLIRHLVNVYELRNKNEDKNKKGI